MADITQFQGQVADPTALQSTPGDYRTLTLTQRLALRMAEGQAPFQDAVERGNVYAVASQAAVSTQAGLSATTPALTLANPAGSGVNLVLWYLSANLAAANAAAAALLIAVGTDSAAAAVSGTLTTAHRNLKLGSANNPKAKTFLAATLPAAPVAMGLLGMGLTGLITTAPGLQPFERWVNGAIVLKPGTNLSIQSSTAASIFCEYIWEEIPE